MATRYVNKSGSNGAAGTSHAVAWLTLAHAIANTSHGDTIYVGSGRYTEGQIDFSDSRTLIADGRVEIVGTSLTHFVRHVGPLTNPLRTFTMTGPFISKGFTSRFITSSGANPAALVATNCRFESMPQVGSNPAIDTYAVIRATRCEFLNITSFVGGGNADILGAPLEVAGQYTNCVFYNVPRIMQNYGIGRFKGNIVHTVTTNIFGAVSWPSSDPTDYADNYFFTITRYSDASLTFTNFLAEHASPRFRYDDAEANPILADPANGMLGIRPTSPCLGLGQQADYIGAHRADIIASENFNTLGTWSVGSMSSGAGTQFGIESGSFSVNAQGNIQGEGTLRSPVWEIAPGVRTLYRLKMQTLEDYPTGVIDKSAADVRPNRPTIEIRTGNATFSQDDSNIGAASAWAEYEHEADLSALQKRFVQARFVFRTDGVAA